MEFNAMQAVKQALLTLVVLTSVNCTDAGAASTTRAPGPVLSSSSSSVLSADGRSGITNIRRDIDDRKAITYILSNPESIYGKCRGHAHMDDSAGTYANMILGASKTTGVDPIIPTALMLRESCFKRNAVNSTTGAFGMGGLLPSTARRVCDSANARYNLGYKCRMSEYKKPSVYITLVMVAVDIYRKYYKSDLHAFAAYTGSNPRREAALTSPQRRRAAAVARTVAVAMAVRNDVVRDSNN